jgi:hypothetical protein
MHHIAERNRPCQLLHDSYQQSLLFDYSPVKLATGERSGSQLIDTLFESPLFTLGTASNITTRKSERKWRSGQRGYLLVICIAGVWVRFSLREKSESGKKIMIPNFFDTNEIAYKTPQEHAQVLTLYRRDIESQLFRKGIKWGTLVENSQNDGIRSVDGPLVPTKPLYNPILSSLLLWNGGR